MNQLSPSDHLSCVTPVDQAEAGRVLSLGWKLFLNVSLMLIPMTMLGLSLSVLGLAFLVGSGNAMFCAAAGLVVVLAAQVAWAGTYPEWPLNRLLVRRLRNAYRDRNSQFDWVRTARMVEWVPRENWAAARLDTAQDVMFIRVGQHGVEMAGDVSCYHFPPASIIKVDSESIRPAGCFHSLHFVVLTVRSENGPLEFPLSYRDYCFGRLRSSHRQRQTVELAHAIRSIAIGGDSSCSDPDGVALERIRENAAKLSTSSITDAVAGSVITVAGGNGSAVVDPINPYAAPRSI